MPLPLPCVSRRGRCVLQSLAGALVAALAFGALPVETTQPRAEAATQTLRRFALLVGTNDGGPERSKLRYANTDARAFGSVLDELGGVAPADRALLENATRTSLDTALKTLQSQLARSKETQPQTRTEALFYYSGHSDETGLLLGKERVTYAELRERLSSLGADVRIAVLDSCASGTLARRKGGTKVPSFLVDASSAIRGQAILTSSSADEASQESDRIGGSFFTHHLLSGLRGAADISGDGRVTLNEAYQFAFHETLARTESTRAGAQHPAYDMELAGAGEIVLTDLRSVAASLTLPENLDGRLFIRDERGGLVVELRKPAGRATTLGLAPGKYSVVREKDGQSARAKFVVPEDGGATLDASNFSALNREATALRGNDEEMPVEGRSQYRTMNLSVFPGVSTNDVLDGPVDNAVSIGLLGARSHRLAAGVAIGFQWVDTDVTGAVVSTAFNRVGRSALAAVAVGGNWIDGDSGLAAAVGGNFIGGNSGVALATGANWVEGSTGAGVAAGINWVEQDAWMTLAAGLNRVGGRQKLGAAAGGNVVDRFTGAQLAAGFNFARRKSDGVMAAAGPNLSMEAFRGLQLSSSMSYASSVRGAQISIINITDEVTGSQIGLVNLARKVNGLQLGLVNLASESNASVGLFSLVRNPRWSVAAFASDWAFANVEGKLGTEYVYSFLAAGRGTTDARNHRTLGAGLGYHFFRRDSRWILDADASFHSVFDMGQGWDSHSGLARARATVGHRVFSELSVIAGPTYNVGIGMNARDSVFERVSIVGPDGSPEVARWLGGFVGLQWGR